jgi:CheY-like chemotaxis protein
VLFHLEVIGIAAPCVLGPRGLQLGQEAIVATQRRTRLARAIAKRRAVDAESFADLMRVGDGSPTALVVDDEPFVRRFVSTVLRRQGWSVLEAADAAAAIAIARGAPIDLLVTDYEMPMTSGVALAEQLRRADEDLPVLVVSGHPDAARSTRNLHGRTAFAGKPFAAEELLSSVGSIVGIARRRSTGNSVN